MKESAKLQYLSEIKKSSELFAIIEKFQVSLPMAAFQAVHVYGYRYLQKS